MPRNTKTKPNRRNDAMMLRRIAKEIGEKKVTGRSPYWKFVCRKRIEESLSLRDRTLMSRLAKLEHVAQTSDQLVDELHTIADDLIDR